MSERRSISTAGLTKEYGRTTAVSEVTLSIDGPRIVGVAGPNGAGKTVLTRLLLGLERPTRGVAHVDDVETTTLRPTDRARIGYMPQHTAVYDDLTVRQNVQFFAELYGVDDPAGATRDALDVVDLWDRRDDTIGSLSGGMVRRTSLAAALVHEPTLLFLDEPTVGLDPKLRAEMWDAFRSRRDEGALILLSTHYLGEVHRCDQVLFLRNGRVLALDTPESFLRRTGTTDLEDAFLALLDAAESTTPTAGGEGEESE